MSGQINDSAGGPATSTSVAGGAIPISDNQYTKSITKDEIKLNKLNADNYQSWADGLGLFLEAKLLWPVVSGMKPCLDAATRPIGNKAWRFDETQARMWIYINLEDSQHNHLKGLATAHFYWTTLKKIHGALGKGRINFLKRRFFNYKAGPSEGIDEISSNLSRLQLTIRNISATEASTDLDIAFTSMNAIDHEVYTMTKFHLEETEDLTPTHTKERLKPVEQHIKDDQATDDAANQTPR